MARKARRPLSAKTKRQEASAQAKGQRRAPRPRPGPRLAELRASMPSALGVAAVEGVLDAVEKGARECGLQGSAAPALRSIFGMLLGVAIDEKKVATIAIDGMEPIRIRKADAQYVAFKSLVDLTRLEVAHAVGKAAAEKGHGEE